MLKGRFKAFLDYFFASMETIQTEAENNADQYSVTLATTTWLDKWGVDLDVPRSTGESDSNYRIRLLLVLRGCGVTKASLEEIVDSVLNPKGFDDCNIYEWFDQGEHDRLNPTWFRVDLPSNVRFGLFEGKGYLGFHSTQIPQIRSYKEAFLNSALDHVIMMGKDEIKRLVEKYKAAGTKALLTMGNYTLYSPDDADYLWNGGSYITYPQSTMDIAYGCIPTPATDGSQLIFGLVDQEGGVIVEFANNSSKVTLNGLTLTNTLDYTEDSSVDGRIIMTSAPVATDKLRARVAMSGTWNTTDCLPVTAPNGALTEFTFKDLSGTTIASYVENSSIITLNGLTLLRGEDYAEDYAAGKITISYTPLTGAILRGEFLESGTPRPNSCVTVQTPNGVITDFSFEAPDGTVITSYTPFTSTIYLNGLALSHGDDYTEVPGTGYIEMFSAPSATDILYGEFTI